MTETSPPNHPRHPDFRFELIKPGNLSRLQPLWLALHEYHQTIAPSLAPFTPADESWRLREGSYRAAFETGAAGWIATRDGRDAGYMFAALRPMPWDATFALPPMMWELVSLVATPEFRGRGLGNALLDYFTQLKSGGPATTELIGVIPDNASALALYKRRGYLPAWLTLTRFQRDSIAKPSSSSWRVELLRAADAGLLKPLWLALHAQHQKTSPELGPFVDDAQSWRILEETWTKQAKAQNLWVVREHSEIIGMASAHVYDRDEIPTYADTWSTAGRIAEIKYMSVAPGWRGQGVGAALLDDVDRSLASLGVRDQLVGAIAPNTGAIKFYQSRGFRPAWLELIKPGPAT